MIRSVLVAGDHPSLEYQLGDDVLIVLVEDGTSRIVDLQGDIVTLDAVGTAMLESTLTVGKAATVSRLAEAFAVPPERIGTDLTSLLDQFTAQGMLRHRLSPESWKRRVRRRGVSSLRLLTPVLAACRSRRLRAWVAVTAAYLSVRACGWANTVRCWTAQPLGADPPAANGPSAVDRVAAAVTHAMVRHPLPVNCKERALASFALARAESIPADIVVGISLFPLAFHAWCEAAGTVVADRRDGYCDRYTPLRRYP